MKNQEVPVFLLDVTGTILVERKGKWPRVCNSFIKGEYTKWAPACIEQISYLRRSGLVDIRWCTAWGNNVRYLESRVGLSPLPIACEDEKITEKTAVALRIIRSGRKLIWADDQAIPKWGPTFDLFMKHNSLLISTDPVVGLQPTDIAEIKSYLWYSE